MPLTDYLLPSRVGVAADLHAPSQATAAVVTYTAAAAGIGHVLGAVYYSYSAAPTGGNLKVEDGSGTTIFSLDITAAGEKQLTFNPPLRGSNATAMIVTLASGAGSVVGKLNCRHWTE